MTTPTRRLVVISAGLRQPSSTRQLADLLATATERALTADGEVVGVTTIELRDHAHDLTNHLLTGFPAPELEAALEAVSAADAVIAVSPIFSASYNGLFKTFVDVLDQGALAGRPVLLGATGGSARHSLALEFALRPLFAYLRADVVPTAVFAAAEDWGSVGVDPTTSTLQDRAERAAGELADLIARRVPQPPATAETDPVDQVTPFEDLLRGRG